jgi:arylsulfatase A-like enzyme
MLDDAGYSSATSYGGVMRTPTFDRLGDEGIRYTHMSVAAVCSPTRGSLLTGYNIHQIGTGIISEFATGYPGYNSQIDYSTPSIAKILTDNGYATAAFGKWHNTPMEEASPAGPFESWPTGMWGFEYFWGFMGGETNQFYPLLLMQNGFSPLTMDQQLEKLEEFGGIDEWGGPHMNNHYSVAWSYASSTPFQWTKQMASHFGGTMSATAVRYPRAVKANGEWRRQFQNVTDIVPTILEVTGVPAPDYVNGQKRKAYPGRSLTYAWNDPDAKTNHPTQYFEMTGFVGLYHEGWSICGKPYRIPWSLDPSAMANFDPLNVEWELYNIYKDPIQQVNVADRIPKK